MVLVGLVKGEDLFACEAKHHRLCFKSFRTALTNYERVSEMDRSETSSS